MSTGAARPEGRVACPADERTGGASRWCELDLRSSLTPALAADPGLARYPDTRYKPAQRREAGPDHELRRGACPKGRPTGDPSPRCEWSLRLCFAATVAITVVACVGLSLNLHRPSPPAQHCGADPGRELRRGTGTAVRPTCDPSPRCERGLWLRFTAAAALAVAVCACILYRPGPPGPGRAPRGDARPLGGSADETTPRCGRGLWSRLKVALAVVPMTHASYTLSRPCFFFLRLALD